MSFFSLLGAVEIGLIFSLVALGVFISFRLLRFPDLTVDGSFPLGGAVCAILISTGTNAWLATLAATAAGAVAGLITGWLNVKLKIMDLLASILMMIALYSINLRIMGGPNVPLINDPTLFVLLQPEGMDDYIARPLILVAIVLAAKLLLDWFFATERGLAIRATGSNARMARAQGVNTGAMLLLGMAISNGLVGLAGALFAQTQGGSDISMGIGTIVIGLAAVIVGESILPSRRLVYATLAVVIGAIAYRFFIALALNSDFIARPLILVFIVLAAKLLLDWFFATERGLAIRATGSNARMARAQGVNTGAMLLLGMAISNGLVGLAGALFAQTQGGSDISMGIGTIVIGLAAVIVGESILPSRRLIYATLAVVIGAIAYRFFIALALNSDFIGLKAQDLNLVTAVLVAVALVIPQLKRKFAKRKPS